METKFTAKDACVIVTFAATLTGVEILTMEGFIVKMGRIDKRVVETPDLYSNSFFKLLFGDL